MPYGFSYPGLGAENQRYSEQSSSGASSRITSSTATGAGAGSAGGPWGALIGGGVGAAGGILGATLGEDDAYNPSAGYKLPPALEIALLRDTNRNLGRIERDYADLDRRQRLVDQSLGVSEAYLRGETSDDAFSQQLNELQRLNLEDVQGLRNLEGQNFKDPQLEGQLSDEKAQLEQQLARAGVGPTGRARALNQFDRLASERRFTRAEELRTGKTARTLERFRAVDQFGSNRARALTESSLLFGQERRALRGENIQRFQQLGQFDYSDQARQALESGLVGPGSIYQQTGVAEGRGLELFQANVHQLERGATERRFRSILGTGDVQLRNRNFSLNQYNDPNARRSKYDRRDAAGIRRDRYIDPNEQNRILNELYGFRR